MERNTMTSWRRRAGMDSHVVLVYRSAGLPCVSAPQAPLGRPRPSAAPDWLPRPQPPVRRPRVVSSHNLRRRRQWLRQEPPHREPLLRLTDARHAPWSASRVKKSLRMLLGETTATAAGHEICPELSRSVVSEVKKPAKCGTETTIDPPHHYYSSMTSRKAEVSSQSLQTQSDNYQSQVTQVLSGRSHLSQMGKQAPVRAEQWIKACTKAQEHDGVDSSFETGNGSYPFRSKRAVVSSLPKANAEGQVEVNVQCNLKAKVDTEMKVNAILETGMWVGAMNKLEVEANKEGRKKEEAKMKDYMKPDMRTSASIKSKTEDIERKETVGHKKAAIHEFICENWDEDSQPISGSEVVSDDTTDIESLKSEVSEKGKPENAYETTYEKLVKANLKLAESFPVTKELVGTMENAITEIRAIRKIEIKPKTKENPTLISDVKNQDKTSKMETQAKEVVRNVLNNRIDVESETKAGGSQKVNEYISKSEKIKKDIMKKEEHKVYEPKLVQTIDGKGEEIFKTGGKNKVGMVKREGIQMNKIKWAGRKNIVIKSQLSKKEIINTDTNKRSVNKREGSKKYGIIGVRTNNNLIKVIGSKKDGFTVKRMKKLRLKTQSEIQMQISEKDHVQEIINLITKTKTEDGKQLLAKRKTDGGMKENKETAIRGEVKAKARAEIKTKSGLEDQTHEKTESVTSEMKGERRKTILKKNVTFSEQMKMKRTMNEKSKADIDTSTRPNAEVESKTKFKAEADAKKRTKEEFEAKAKEKLEGEERLRDKAVSEGKTKSGGRTRAKDDGGYWEKCKSECVAKVKSKEESETKSKAEAVGKENGKTEYDILPEYKAEFEAKSKMKEESDAQAKTKVRIDAMNKVIAGVEALSRRRMMTESKVKSKQETEIPVKTKEKIEVKPNKNVNRDTTINYKSQVGHMAKTRAESEPSARNKIETDYKAKVRAESESRSNNKTESESKAKVRFAIGAKTEAKIGAVVKAIERDDTKTTVKEEIKSESEDRTKTNVGAESKVKIIPETKLKIEGVIFEKATDYAKDYATNALANSQPKVRAQDVNQTWTKANTGTTTEVGDTGEAMFHEEVKLKKSVRDEKDTSMVNGEAGVSISKFIAPKIAVLLCDRRDQCALNLPQWNFADFNCPIWSQNNVDTIQETRKRSLATQTPLPASTQTTWATSAHTQTGASTQTPTSLPTLLSFLSRTLVPSITMAPVAPLAAPSPATKTASTTTTLTIPTSRGPSMERLAATSTQTEIGVFMFKGDAIAATRTTRSISTTMIKDYLWGS